MLSICLTLALLGLALVQCACGEKTTSADGSKIDAVTKNVYIVTHIDVASAAFSDGAGKAIQKYAAESRKE